MQGINIGSKQMYYSQLQQEAEMKIIKRHCFPVVLFFIKKITMEVGRMKKEMVILAVALSCALSVNVPAVSIKDIDDRYDTGRIKS